MMMKMSIGKLCMQLIARSVLKFQATMYQNSLTKLRISTELAESV